MPFLLKFLNQIKHESALQMLAAEQSKERLTLGLSCIEESIQQATGRNGVYLGETINLYGPSGGGKSWVLNLITEHALQHDNENNVIYLDLDRRFVLRRPFISGGDDNSNQDNNNSDNINERFHLFQPSRSQLLSTLQGLDDWFYHHTNERVTMVLVDGARMDGLLTDKLKRLQHKWSFVLVTTSLEPHPYFNYRFHVYKKANQVEMKLITWSPPSSSCLI
ncbi:hypothetical protein BDC45DRAFT_508375 [Circinella umbellata]|nr:hypothetical protein BDC45DRAFT_508375 [Circinella umbellata]